MVQRQQALRFESHDYYAYLNLDQTATAAQIRRHFRDLALHWHPDKQPAGRARERASEIFVKVNEAHEVLTDLEQRHRYDEVWRRRHQGPLRCIPEWAHQAGRRALAQRSGCDVERRADHGSRGGESRASEAPVADALERNIARATSFENERASRPGSCAEGARGSHSSTSLDRPFATEVCQSLAGSTSDEAGGGSREPTLFQPSRGPERPLWRRAPGSSLRDMRRASTDAQLDRDHERRESDWRAYQEKSRRQESQEAQRRAQQESFFQEIERNRRMQQEWRRESCASEEGMCRSSSKEVDEASRDSVFSLGPKASESWRMKGKSDSFFEELAQRKLAREQEALASEHAVHSKCNRASPGIKAAASVAAELGNPPESPQAQNNSNTVEEARVEQDEAMPPPHQYQSEVSPPVRQESQLWDNTLDAVGSVAGGAAAATSATVDGVAALVGGVGSGLASFVGALGAVAWFKPGPLQPEVGPGAKWCPRCSRPMPKAKGANFCRSCHYVVRPGSTTTNL